MSDSDSYDKQAKECSTQGGVYTGGANEKYTGCGANWCCRPSDSSWFVDRIHGDAVVNTSDSYDKQARDCTSSGGVYTGGINTNFPSCPSGNWCCS